ncbi:MAG TPA: Uma2 family endonuclease [Steroidobacteraceae bacterium]
MIAVMQEDLVRRHRLTVHEYYRMAEVGLLAPDARVELIEGEIIDMPPSGPPHASVLNRLSEKLILALSGTATVRQQSPMHLDDFSEPEPDIAVVKQGHYGVAHPRPADVLLAIEVSLSSLSFDRNRKLPLYARAGIPEYWIVDVVKPVLHVLHTPQNGRYLHEASIPRPGLLTLSALADSQVDLTGLFEGL